MNVLSVPYMRVTVRDDTRMVLNRAPPFRSWFVFVALLAFGGYCAYESKSWTYGSLYFACGVMLAHIAMDRWEECNLDKSKNRVGLFHLSLYDVMLRRKPDREVVAHIDEIVDVRVEAETLKYAGTTHNVALVFDSGYSLALTSTGTYGNKEAQEKLAAEIRDFLNLVPPAVIMENLNAAIAEKIARSGPPPGSSPADYQAQDKTRKRKS